MQSRKESIPLGPLARGLCLALAAGLVIETSGCASANFIYYNSTPLYYYTPEKLLVHSAFDGTQVSLGAIFCYRKDMLYQFFPTGAGNALWREDVLPVYISVRSDDPKSYTISQNLFHLRLNDKDYLPITAGQAYDLAWQSKRSYLAVQKGIYYTALIVFSVLTLGLGAVIFTLPSPFQQPVPTYDPFGRDLGYKAFPETLTLRQGMLAAGMLYFHYESENRQQQQIALSASLLPSSSSETVKSASLEINLASPDDSNRALEWMQNFFY